MLTCSVSQLATLAVTCLAVVSAAPTELSKRGEVLIGYRGVPKAQAEAYVAAGNTLVYVKGSLAKQIGDGVYLVNTNADMPTSDMYCEVYADEAAFTAVPRIWVPQSLEGKYLGKPLLKKYSAIDKQVITDMGWTTENAVPEKVMEVMKISRIDFSSTQPYQLVIPQSALTEVKTRVTCKTSKAELSTTPVDISLWTHGAKGTAQ